MIRPSNAVAPRTHVVLPEEVAGYAFDPAYSWWSTVVAEGSTNLVKNPSFELTNGADFVDEYDATGTFTELGEETIIQTYPAVGAPAGRRVARLVGATGIGTLDYTEDIAVTPGPYTFSIDVYVIEPPARLVLAIMNGVAVVATRSWMISQPGWQRIWLTYTEQATANRQLRLSLNNTGVDTIIFYTDAWQFERKAYPTTYLDGDMVGFQDSRPYTTYFWHGAPHASTSTRDANTGSGGRMISWSDIAKFLTTSIVGLNMPPYEQRVQTLGNGKQIHTGMETLTRDFTITGRIFGRSPSELLRKRNALMRLLRPTNTASNDQMIVRYQQVNDAERLVGKPLDIICVYNDGLRGGMTNFYQEALAVQFAAVQPALMEIYESSVGLDLYKELEPNMIVYRDELGEYFNLGTGDTSGGVVHRVGFLRDGRIVAFGNYTQIAGVVADYGAIWTGTTWEEIPGTDSGVNDIDDGYRMAYPLTVGTVGGSVFEYDPVAETWAELGGNGFIGPINSMARDEHGDIYVGGQFEFFDDAVTVYNNVAKWDFGDEEWVQLGDGLTDPSNLFANPLEVKSVIAPNDGFVYFAGTFAQGESGATTTLANQVIRWNIETEVYEGMGAGFDVSPNQLLQGDDGYIYAVGPFAQDGTESYDLRGFARWNGYSWEEVFALVRPGGVHGADGVAQDEEGIFWFYNVVVDEDDLFDIEGSGLGKVPFFGWRNGVFYPPYMNNASIRHLAIGPGNRAIHVTDSYVGAGTPTQVPAMTRITYEGGATAPVVLHFEGPGQINQVRSYSTEGGIYGRNTLTMSASETLVMRNDTQRTLFYSNARRNLYGRLLGGASNMAALRLIPGENRFSVLVINTDEDDTEAWVTWKNRYDSLGENE